MANQHKTAFLFFNTNRRPFASLALAHFAQQIVGNRIVKLVGKSTEKCTYLLVGGSEEKFVGETLSARYLARFLASVGGPNFYPTEALAATQVDFFVSLAERLSPQAASLVDFVEQLNNHLQLRSYLVGHSLTLADFAVWSALCGHAEWNNLASTQGDTYVNVLRWYETVDSLPESRLANPSSDVLRQKMEEKRKKDATGSLDIGISQDQNGLVCTRFPPEPSGYLHIGHAKAALLNHHYAREYNGKLILRFDDTNPSKEKEEFVDNIYKDLATLEVKYDQLTHTSDHFDRILELGTWMLREGKAYIDDTPVEQMRRERGEGIESARRNQSVEENLRLWNEMQIASEEGLKCCMRAKIDMQAKNKTLRDPTLFRCNLTPHHRTGTRYKVYPTYDFACPIVDSIEGVTHALRTTEYHDRDEQYYWVIEALGLRKPTIIDFSRLSFNYTVLSKRKLTWFVANGFVQDWTDPRFPTVQGMIRRGLTVSALREFILKQGFSKASVSMEWDQIWATNKKHVDPVAHRYVAVAAETRVPFHLENFEGADFKTIPLHPKNEALGTRVMPLAATIYLEGDDAAEIEANEEVTLMHWGNAIVRTIERDADGKITALRGVLHLEGSVKTTKKKLTFVSNAPAHASLQLVELDHLIDIPVLREEHVFEDHVNRNTWFTTQAIGDICMRSITKGQIIQLERRGYFICDKAAENENDSIVLIYVPDGRQKAMSSLSQKVNLKMA